MLRLLLAFLSFFECPKLFKNDGSCLFDRWLAYRVWMCSQGEWLERGVDMIMPIVVSEVSFS